MASSKSFGAKQLLTRVSLSLLLGTAPWAGHRRSLPRRFQLHTALELRARFFLLLERTQREAIIYKREEEAPQKILDKMRTGRRQRRSSRGYGELHHRREDEPTSFPSAELPFSRRQRRREAGEERRSEALGNKS
jgi:hypothetical protein